jgi:hypothetical protein
MNDSNAIHDSTIKGLVLVCVVVAHGVALIAVLSLRAPMRANSAEFVSALLLVDERKRRELPPPPKQHTEERKPQREQSRQIVVPETRTTDDLVPALTITDWSSQREKTAGDVVGREVERANSRSLLSKPRVIELPTRGSVHKPGDTQHFDDGEIITWINDRCYATNQQPSGPRLISDMVNVICKNKDQPSRDDYFDYMKPDYLRDPNAPPTKFEGMFSDQAKCEYSAARCD